MGGQGQTISVTVELPASEAGRIATAYCANHGYGPTSAADAVAFVRQSILDDLYRQTLEYEAGIAASAARDGVWANPNDPLAQALLTPVQPGPDGGGGGQGETGATGATGN